MKKMHLTNKKNATNKWKKRIYQIQKTENSFNNWKKCIYQMKKKRI